MDAIAEMIQARTNGKHYAYNIFDGMYEGTCTVESVKHDPALNQFIFHIKDLSSQRFYTIDRCHIYLKEIIGDK